MLVALLSGGEREAGPRVVTTDQRSGQTRVSLSRSSSGPLAHTPLDRGRGGGEGAGVQSRPLAWTVRPLVRPVHVTPEAAQSVMMMTEAAQSVMMMTEATQCAMMIF